MHKRSFWKQVLLFILIGSMIFSAAPARVLADDDPPTETVTITLDANGGYMDEAHTEDRLEFETPKSSFWENKSDGGYIRPYHDNPWMGLAGWDRDPSKTFGEELDFQGLWITPTVLYTEDVTYYAIWYDSRDYIDYLKAGQTATVKCYNPGDYHVFGFSPEKEGNYVFYVSCEEGSGAAPMGYLMDENQNVILSGQNSAVTVYPGQSYYYRAADENWTAKEITVGVDLADALIVLHGQGGLFANKEPECAWFALKGQKMAVPAVPVLEDDRYHFLGWALSEDGEPEIEPDELYEVTGNADLYAVWKVGTLKNAQIDVDTERGLSYSGKAITPAVTVWMDGEILDPANYTVSYANNINAGTATVTVKGIGDYTGTATETFTIGAININKALIDQIPEQTYTGSALTPEVTVWIGEKKLVKDVEYTVSYSDNIRGAIATVSVHGKGNYTGSKQFKFRILPADINKAEVEAIPDQTYTGGKLTPEVTVKWNGEVVDKAHDYKVEYANNQDAGTATITITGKECFTGKKTVTFKILPKPVAGTEISGLKTLVYNKKARKPSPVVTDGERTLRDGIDYSVSYADNQNAGTATVTITGKGNYTGTKTAAFTIQPKSFESVKISGIKTLTYTGKTRKQTALAVKDGKTKLKYKTDYKLKYKNAKAAGKATITFIGLGNYTGKVVKYFIIRPAKTKITAAKNSAAGSITVKWAAAKSGTGYEIQYGTKSSFKGAKTLTVKKLKTKAKTVKKLKKGKTYYVRVRVYKAIDGQKVYSQWSAKKKVKIKK